jgi:hypothetical protein
MHVTVAMLRLFNDIIRYFTLRQLPSVSVRHDVDRIHGGRSQLLLDSQLYAMGWKLYQKKMLSAVVPRWSNVDDEHRPNPLRFDRSPGIYICRASNLTMPEFLINKS